MKQQIRIIFFFITFLFLSCNSVKCYNKSFDKKIQPDKLKLDVDYIYKKLVKLHPQLNYYTSKKELDYKFDSLKNTITDPLTIKEFYFKLSPVINEIRQGHTSVIVPAKKLTKQQKREIKSSKLFTPISDFEVEFFNGKLYVVKSIARDSSILIGAEILCIDSLAPNDIYNKYYNSVGSDGYNSTFKKRYLNQNILDYYYVEHGYRDSVQIKLNIFGDTVNKIIKRKFLNSKNDVKINSKNKLNTKNCHLSFIGKDSNIALLKIDNFMSFDYSKFFQKIDSVKSPKLIIDLRSNPGGMILSGKKLFSYLIDTTYNFIEPHEVTSRFSLLYTRRFREKKIIGKFFHLAFMPITIIRYSIRLMSVKKIGDRFYYYPLIESIKVKPAKKYYFKNKIYFITNGGTFSTSCILSSNIKGNKLATFVGEETGGDYNGTCAGQIPTFTLPHSNLKVNFGLMYIKPACSSLDFGRGIFPDVEIIPTLQDRIKQVDPELEWILNDN
jgi:hypothetical protein